jgi:hypothetical protein
MIEAFIVEQLAQLNWLFGTNWPRAGGDPGVSAQPGRTGTEKRFQEHAQRQASPSSGRQFIAIDGKALQEARIV